MSALGSSFNILLIRMKHFCAPPTHYFLDLLSLILDLVEYSLASIKSIKNRRELWKKHFIVLRWNKTWKCIKLRFHFTLFSSRLHTKAPKSFSEAEKKSFDYCFVFWLLKVCATYFLWIVKNVFMTWKKFCCAVRQNPSKINITNLWWVNCEEEIQKSLQCSCFVWDSFAAIATWVVKNQVSVSDEFIIQTA